MSRDPFETQLEALFAQPPRFADTATFTARVDQRVASLARWRADIMAAAWIVAGGGALYAVIASLDEATLTTVTAAIAAAQEFGGGWLLPILAIGIVLGAPLLEEKLVRD